MPPLPTPYILPTRDPSDPTIDLSGIEVLGGWNTVEQVFSFAGTMRVMLMTPQVGGISILDAFAIVANVAVLGMVVTAFISILLIKDNAND